LEEVIDQFHVRKDGVEMLLDNGDALVLVVFRLDDAFEERLMADIVDLEDNQMMDA
jgi:hypothetical protein